MSRTSPLSKQSKGQGSAICSLHAQKDRTRGRNVEDASILRGTSRVIVMYSICSASIDMRHIAILPLRSYGQLWSARMHPVIT
jgi:hypothetical protein